MHATLYLPTLPEIPTDFYKGCLGLAVFLQLSFFGEVAQAQPADSLRCEAGEMSVDPVMKAFSRDYGPDLRREMSMIFADNGFLVIDFSMTWGKPDVKPSTVSLESEGSSSFQLPEIPTDEPPAKIKVPVILKVYYTESHRPQGRQFSYSYEFELDLERYSVATPDRVGSDCYRLHVPRQQLEIMPYHPSYREEYAVLTLEAGSPNQVQ